MKTSNPNGRALARRLLDRIRQEGVSQSQLALMLGISAGQVSKLLSGRSSFAQVSDGVLRAVANYLKVPVVHCFVMGGRLGHADFFLPSAEPLAKAMESVVASEWADGLSIASEDLIALPQDVQLLILRLSQNRANLDAATEGMSPWLARWLFGSTSYPKDDEKGR